MLYTIRYKPLSTAPPCGGYLISAFSTHVIPRHIQVQNQKAPHCSECHYRRRRGKKPARAGCLPGRRSSTCLVAGACQFAGVGLAVVARQWRRKLVVASRSGHRVQFARHAAVVDCDGDVQNMACTLLRAHTVAGMHHKRCGMRFFCRFAVCQRDGG